MRILFIDDDTELAESVKDLLEDLGHQVTCQSNVTEALQLLSSGTKFNLIIVDFHMPFKSGLDLMREGANLIQDTPAVLFTGHIHPEDELKARELGFLEVFIKPMPMSELITHLELRFFSLAQK